MRPPALSGIRPFGRGGRIGVILLGLVLASLSCGSPDSSSSASPPAPKGGHSGAGPRFSAPEFEAYLAEQCRRNPQLRLSPQLRQGLQAKFLERKLLVAEAEARGLPQDPEVRREWGEAREQILIKNLLTRKAAELGGEIKITEAEIRRFYEEMGREIHFRYWVAPDARQAREALARWREGQAPAGLEDSGILKWAALEEGWTQRLWGLPLKEPQLLEVGSEYILVEVLNRRNAPTPPLEEVKGEILRELTQRRNQALLQTWINGLKEKARGEMEGPGKGR
jgi:hypothetical protein